ncbi:MAG: hypothetical protein RL642_1240 [Bacteroidota bacterium]
MYADLHIVTNDYPNAVDNAQMSDVYYLIKSLHEHKVNIHLHCFTKNDIEPPLQLKECCSSIQNYDRDFSNISFKIDLPFHVSTRANKKLIENLNKDNSPILFIGLSTSYPLYANLLEKDRKTAIRLNKNESAYYRQLSTLVPWKGKKLHYQIESWRMSNYLKKLIAKKIFIFSNSPNEVSAIESKQKVQIQHLPLFTGILPLIHQSGNGHFCLFHGRLSNEETSYAAFWLLEHVFNQLEIPFVIAGSNPSLHLENAAHVRQHTCLVANPGEKELQELIKKAQLVLSPAFILEENDESLLQTLALGRHLLINPKKSTNKAIQSFCHIAHSPQEFIEKTKSLFDTAFSEEEKMRRQEIIHAKLQDQESTIKLISWLN